MAKTAVKIISDPEIGEVVFRKTLRSRRISIRVHPVRGVSVGVPYPVPYVAAKLFFETRRNWILETMARQRERYGDVKPADEKEVEAMREKAKALLPARLACLARRYGFRYNRVAIKHNSTNWGSCSAKDNINLNLNIVRLPECQQDYILLHELCHLRHHNHGPEFHSLLESILRVHTAQAAASGDAEAQEIVRKASVSGAACPYDSVFSREIKKYRLI